MFYKHMLLVPLIYDIAWDDQYEGKHRCYRGYNTGRHTVKLLSSRRFSRTISIVPCAERLQQHFLHMTLEYQPAAGKADAGFQLFSRQCRLNEAKPCSGSNGNSPCPSAGYGCTSRVWIALGKVLLDMFERQHAPPAIADGRSDMLSGINCGQIRCLRFHTVDGLSLGRGKAEVSYRKLVRWSNSTGRSESISRSYLFLSFFL